MQEKNMGHICPIGRSWVKQSSIFKLGRDPNGAHMNKSDYGRHVLQILQTCFENNCGIRQ